MKPIDFPERNVVWAENQDEYGSLPASRDGVESISCWQLSWRERIAALFRGRIWLRQLYFGGPLQPVSLDTANPFERRRRWKP